MVLPPSVFETDASACSATRAWSQRVGLYAARERGGYREGEVGPARPGATGRTRRRLAYTTAMKTPTGLPVTLPAAEHAHLANVVENLQLVADLGYGDAALALPQPDGALAVVADARPVTAVAAVASSRVGRTLSQHDEPEAYEALRTGRVVRGERRRTTRGIS